MSILGSEKKIKILIGTKGRNLPRLSITITRKGFSMGTDLREENVLGFIQALRGFGSEIGSRSENFGQISFKESVMSYAVIGNLVLGLIAYEAKDSERVEEVFKDLIRKDFLKALIEVYDDPTKKTYMNTTLIPQIKDFLQKKDLI